jgi:hypothetical protein
MALKKKKVGILFQLNGAPPHFIHEVRNVLNLRFSNPDISSLFLLLEFKKILLIQRKSDI